MRRRRPVARAVVGTAVVAGTAGYVHHRQAQKWGAQEQAQQAAANDAATQQMLADQQAQIEMMQQQQAMAAQAAPPPAPAPAPAAAPAPDLMAQLNQLAAMHTAGVLTDAEFAAAKAKLLGA
jgi:alkylation response protein AidB-like acyl-CoA dehydrogenase